MPFNLDITNPADSAAERVYPANERAFRTNVQGYLNTEHDIETGRHAILFLTQAERDAITWPPGALFYNLTIGQLQFNIGVVGVPNWVSIGPADARQQVTVATVGGALVIPAPDLVLTLVGAGGGGAGGTTDPTNPGGGGGGGSGAMIIYPLIGLTPGETLSLTIGVAGTGGAAGNNGVNGGNTIIASGTQIITTATAGGGAGGTAGVGPSPNGGGLAGSASGGIIGVSINSNGTHGKQGFSIASAVGIPGNGGQTSTGMGLYGNGGDGGSAGTVASSPGLNGVLGACLIQWLET